MIKAERRKWAIFVFDIYLERLLKKYFNDFILINNFPKLDENKSLIIAPNHFSWWDGFLVYFLLRKKSNKKIFIMMLENQLRKYWFFQKIGCFSTNPDNRQSTVATLRYALNLLDNPDNCVVIFPQGEIEPFEKLSLNYHKGIEFLAKHTGKSFDVLLLANKIFYSNEKLPFVLSRFGGLIDSFELKLNETLLYDKFSENVDLLRNNFSTSGESLF
uniref:Phospholipid/glycerol acyltransferase domain-containing protein n=1 Tax=Ignavibacterium album TaxID=591197 RepID=A0A7V3E6E1_9BACT